VFSFEIVEDGADGYELCEKLFDMLVIENIICEGTIPQYIVDEQVNVQYSDGGLIPSSFALLGPYSGGGGW